jgi:hypothetical protein
MNARIVFQTAFVALLLSACAPDPQAPAATTPAPAPATPAAVPVESNPQLQARVGQGVGIAVSQATDAQAHEYATVLAAVTGEMLARDPDACVRLLLPEVFGAAKPDEFPASHNARFLAAQQAIFTTAATAPNPVPQVSEAGPLYEAIAAQLQAQHGADALAGLDGRGVPPATTCRAWNRLYSGLAQAPVEAGGRVMRWMNAP